MKFISKRTLQDLKCADHEEAAKLMASWYRNLAALWTEWQVRCTSLLLCSVVGTRRAHHLVALAAWFLESCRQISCSCCLPLCAQTSLKNLLAGQYEPFMFRTVFFGEPGKDKSKVRHPLCCCAHALHAPEHLCQHLICLKLEAPHMLCCHEGHQHAIQCLCRHCKHVPSTVMVFAALEHHQLANHHHGC